MTCLRAIGLFAGAAIGVANVCHAQDEATRLLSSVRNQVVALRVSGDKSATAQFPAGEPPIWGTGFVVGPLTSGIDGRQRIITAGHVVQKDEMWAQRGGGPARTVYPSVLGDAGRVLIEGFRGVAVNPISDIAQVYGPRNLKPVVIQHVPLSPNDRYFVVSWGLDDAWSQPTEEPYIKEIKVVAPAADDPLVEPGLALVEIVPGQASTSFKQSESGSPVFNSSGQAVGIMIREWTDAVSGVARRGIALPFAKIASWLDGVREKPINEPTALVLANLIRRPSNSTTTYTDTPSSPIADFNGSCVFLGKYSARNRDPSSEQALLDAPIGVSYLNRVISFFPSANPNEVSDKEAVVTKELPEQESVSIPPRAAVNIRSHCPEIVPKPKRLQEWERIAYYGPVLARADSSFQIRIKSVQRQAYLEDFFYWGQIVSVSMRGPTK